MMKLSACATRQKTKDGPATGTIVLSDTRESWANDLQKTYRSGFSDSITSRHSDSLSLFSGFLIRRSRVRITPGALIGVFLVDKARLWVSPFCLTTSLQSVYLALSGASTFCNCLSARYRLGGIIVKRAVLLTRCLWDHLFDDLADLAAQGFSLGFSRAIEAFVGEVWIADALKDGHRWVVRAPTPDQAFGKIGRVTLPNSKQRIVKSRGARFSTKLISKCRLEIQLCSSY